MRSMLLDVVDDQLSLSSALPRTLKGLLRPGFLTTEYLRGRIVRYIPPFRLYLVVSVVFFLLLSWEVLHDADHATNFSRGLVGGLADEEDNSTPADTSVQRAGTTTTATESPSPAVVPTDTAEPESWLERTLGAKAQQLEREGEPAIQRGLETFFERAPQLVFLLLPLFALLLGRCDIRRNRFYVEHFVFALHVHAFAFLLFTLIILLPDGPWTTALILWVGAYVLLAMKRVYRQSWLETGAKFLLLTISYSLLLLLGFVAAVLLTLLLL